MWGTGVCATAVTTPKGRRQKEGGEVLRERPWPRRVERRREEQTVYDGSLAVKTEAA